VVSLSDHGLAQVIAEVARALQQEQTAQATLQTMVDLAVDTIPGCDHAGVSLVRGKRIVTPAASDDVPPAVDRIQDESDQGPCLDAIREAEVYLTEDLCTESRWPAFSARAAEETGIRSILSFRLFVQEDTLCALNLYARSPQAFGEDSRAVGEVFAGHAAVALTHALVHDQVSDLREELAVSRAQRERYEEQAAIAIALQRSMLTDLPAPEDLQLEAVYLPAAHGHEVGGDWYDAFVLPDGSTALVIGDVTGHDAAAAATMGAVRNLLRGIAWDRAAPPSQVLRRLDAAIAGLGMDAITTLVHARVQRSADDGTAGARQLCWSSAGHPPPLLVFPDGAVEVLQASPELLLGVSADTVRTDHVVPLPPGSTVLLYTDGLVERRGEVLAAGIERLVRTAGDLAHLPLPELLGELVQRLVGAAAEDDTAVLGLRLHPEDR
jgi:serine phosphatase RsbU (regulator of sigma subunit)